MPTSNRTSALSMCHRMYTFSPASMSFQFSKFVQGWRKEFSDGGADSSDEGAKICFQGTINAINLRKNRFSPSDEGLACFDEGAIAP